MVYDPIRVVDSKFVLDDVEFYVVMVGGVVKSIYFNEFQKEVWSRSQYIPVDNNDDGVFTLVINGANYRIDDGKVVKVDAVGIAEAHPIFNHQFSQDLFSGDVEGTWETFKIDGVWYVLEKDDDGNYGRAFYARVDDSLLTPIDVSRDGIG